jgi:hypothetical protein
MENTALNISEFQHDLREQYKLETSRTVKIFMLTYRCVAVLCMVGLTQIIFAIVSNYMQNKEIDTALKIMSEAEKP